MKNKCIFTTIIKVRRYGKHQLMLVDPQQEKKSSCMRLLTLILILFLDVFLYIVKTLLRTCYAEN